jgi:NAD-dependent deacetylase
MNKIKIVVLSGAGISAESGIKTFRDANGLWEGYDVMEVASPEGWEDNPELVLKFYNQRRTQLLEVKPNLGHLALAELESHFDIEIITQNVDNLHEVAGSTKVTHLHGELLKVRSTLDETLVYNWTTDLNIGDLCEKNSQLRPHIVWFGEQVPLIEKAIEIISDADIVIVVGTSMQVYPAAGLLNYAKSDSEKYYIDPKPASLIKSYKNLTILSETATTGLPKIVQNLMNKLKEELN